MAGGEGNEQTALQKDGDCSKQLWNTSVTVRKSTVTVLSVKGIILFLSTETCNMHMHVLLPHVPVVSESLLSMLTEEMDC